MPPNQPEEFSPSPTQVYAAGIQPTMAPNNNPFPKRASTKRRASRPTQPYLSVYPAQPVNLGDVDAPRAPRIDTNFVTHGYHQRESPTTERSFRLGSARDTASPSAFGYLNGWNGPILGTNNLLGKLRQQYYSSSVSEKEKLASFLAPGVEYTATTRQAAALHVGALKITGDTIKFISLCLLWYLSSAITNNTGKHILNHFNFPVTLTWVQFGFVAIFCFVSSRILGFSRLRRPTKQVLSTTLPLALFQIGGHIFSSVATSMVPVSFVHTIKALSPLFTVIFYRIGFHIHYSPAVYVSLIPLTAGVMLACSSSVSVSNFSGFLCALGSTIIFVTQNVFSKKLLFNDPAASSKRLDKINLLFYSSSTAFFLMAPIWLYSDGFAMMSDWLWFQPPHLLHHTQSAAVAGEGSWSVPLHFLVNGTTHFAQNILAFSLLSITSPVTYSIASLVKRIFVITMAILWFGQRTSLIQGCGIVLTFVGLYMYQNAKQSVESGERKVRDRELHDVSVLPVNMANKKMMMGTQGAMMGNWVGGGQPGLKMM